MSSFYGNIVVNLNEGNTSLSSLQLDDNGNFYGLNEDSQRIAGPFNAVSTGANIIATLTYKNYDGSQTIATRNFINGIPQSEAPINPFRNATAQYEYSFAGWADNTNQTSGQLSINSLWHDKIVYAAYTATQRTYTVTWKDSNGTILETDSNVPYGTYPSYDGTPPNYNGQTFKQWSPSIGNAITGNTQFTATYYNTYNVYFYSGQTLLDTVAVIEGQNAIYSGTTPTKTGVNDPENYTFSGWDPLPNNIQANTTCYAQFTYTIITDTWDEIFANTANGTYKTKYNIGDTKELDLGTQGVINMQIIAFDADDLADGTGKAPITWLSKQLMNTSHVMNSSSITTGGWAASEMRAYYQNTIKPLIPSNVRSAIQSVTKYTRYVDTSNDNVSSSEDIWIPSKYEMFGSSVSNVQSLGVTYTSFFTDNASRIKMKLTSSSGNWWWFRTADSFASFTIVGSRGSSSSGSANASGGCALGFCTGGIAPSQSSVDENGNILDSWDTIIENISDGTYKTKYSVGNTKELDLGTEGTINMQIIAFDADDLADGSGKAPITWLSKQLLNTSHVMNSTDITTGGWAASEMRAYYQNTIKPLIPSNVRSAIQSVTKYTRYVDTSNDNVSSSEDIWIPSRNQMYGTGNKRESQGVTYTSFFTDNASRIKMKLTDSSGFDWWYLRTAYSSYGFASVDSDGYSNPIDASFSGGCVLGFCTGGIAPSQSSVDENGNILDSWDTIISNIDNGTYSTKYSIGNTKQLDLGTQGTVNMQIVAFDADELADGSGTAPITWISKELLNTNHRINPNLITNYSYPDSPSWTGNSSNVWMTQTAYCSNSTAEATWTVTAIEAGTLSIGYKTSSANTSNNKLTVEVNGTAIATNHARTSYVTHTVECAAGDTVTVHAIYQLLIQDNQIGSMKFESTGGINITASVEDGPKRVRDSYQTGTGSIGGWEQSEMRTYLRETVKPLIPSIVRSAVVEVTKTQPSYNTAGKSIMQTTTDDVWLPSDTEMFGSSALYHTAFPNDTSRIKKKAGAASASWWWLRSAKGTNFFSYVYSSGSNYSNNTYAVGEIALGFCLGGTPTQTSDITDGAYGVEWDYSNSSPVLTRKGLAANFADPTPATSLSGTGSSPFDNIQPWAGMKRYNIIDGAVSYSEDDAGFSETDYDTVVYIPEFYYFASKDTENSKWTWAISPTAKEGYSKHPGSGRYVGRYHTSGSSSGVYSKSGVKPLVSTSRSNFRTYSHNKGTKWWMIDIATWSALQMLYLVEFANFYSQDTLGTGYAGVTSAVAAGGGTDNSAYHTLKLSAVHNQYRWVEDPFSNCQDQIDGFIAYNRTVYIGTDNATFADSTSALTATGITLPSTNYISGFGYSEESPWAFIPDTASGDETTYVTDHVLSSTGTNALYVGGGYSTSTNCGFFYFNAKNSTAYTFNNLGSRLLYIP